MAAHFGATDRGAFDPGETDDAYLDAFLVEVKSFDAFVELSWVEYWVDESRCAVALSCVVHQHSQRVASGASASHLFEHCSVDVLVVHAGTAVAQGVEVDVGDYVSCCLVVGLVERGCWAASAGVDADVGYQASCY